jgi:hypothetical protein
MPQDKKPRRLASVLINCVCFVFGVMSYKLWVYKFVIAISIEIIVLQLHEVWEKVQLNFLLKTEL